MKDRILKKLIEELEKKEALFIRQMNWAQEEANYHKGAMQSRYDTFKEEAQYKVDIYKSKTAELKQNIFALKQFYEKLKKGTALETEYITVGSLIKLKMDGKESFFFVLPAGGGEKIDDEIGSVNIITYKSPLGYELNGKSENDEFYININGKTITYKVLEIIN